MIYVPIFNVFYLNVLRFSKGRRCSDGKDAPLFRCEIIDIFPPLSQAN